MAQEEGPTATVEAAAQPATPAPAPAPPEPKPPAESRSPMRTSRGLTSSHGGGSPKTPLTEGGRRGGGKSPHMNTVRSLGLLHDLQEYIVSMETLTAEQRKEIERMRDERKDVERSMCKSEQQERGAFGDYFSNAEVTDLPPRLRSLVEDNRSLKEQLKKYKGKNASLEHQASQQQNQLVALCEANERLKLQVAECSRTPAEAEREEVLKTKLEQKENALMNAEHSVGVLRSKVETDSKLYRSNLGAVTRERDALKKQLAAANKGLEDKEKEVRALQLELRRAKAKMAPNRQNVAAGLYVPPEADDAAPGFGLTDPDGRQAKAGGSEPEDERIRIMLMVVREEVPVEVQVPVAMPGTPTALKGAATDDAGALAQALQGLMQEQERQEGKEEEEVRQEKAQDGPPAAAEAQEQQQQQEEEPQQPAAPLEAPKPVSSQEDDADAGPQPPQAEPTVSQLPVPEGDGAVDVPAGPSGTPDTAAAATTQGDGPAEVEAAEPSGSSSVAKALEEEAQPAPKAASKVDEAAEAAARAPAEAEASQPSVAEPHTHASAPLPVPYSRTAARAAAGPGSKGSATASGAAGKAGSGGVGSGAGSGRASASPSPATAPLIAVQRTTSVRAPVAAPAAAGLSAARSARH